MTQINIVGISILGIFMSFVLQKKNKVQSDYILMLTIFQLAILLFSDIWVKQSLSSFSLLLHILIAFYLFPSVLIYGLLLIDRNKIKKQWWWLTSYAVCVTVYVLMDFFIFNSYDKEGLRKLYEYPPTIYHVFYKGHFLYVILILVWFLKRLTKYQQKIKEYYSNTETIHLNWFRGFIWMYIVINFIAPIIFLLYNFDFINEIEVPYLILNVLLVTSLFYFVFNGIKQYSVANFQETALLENKNKPINQVKKYQSSSMTDEEMDAIYNQLLQFFEEEKLYCDAQLKIQNLADRLNVSSNKISQTINSKTEKPFYDFVNTYRVEHFKSLLQNPEKQVFTILGLGLDSGFNSKASLNRIFKEFTGLSPKEFQSRAA